MAARAGDLRRLQDARRHRHLRRRRAVGHEADARPGRQPDAAALSAAHRRERVDEAALRGGHRRCAHLRCGTEPGAGWRGRHGRADYCHRPDFAGPANAGAGREAAAGVPEPVRAAGDPGGMARGRDPRARAREPVGELPDRHGDGGAGRAPSDVQAQPRGVRQPRRGGLPGRPGRAAAASGRGGGQPAHLRAVAGRSRSSAHRAGHRQPLLADVLRDRAGQDGGELRDAGRVPRAIRSCSTGSPRRSSTPGGT